MFRQAARRLDCANYRVTLISASLRTNRISVSNNARCHRIPASDARDNFIKATEAPLSLSLNWLIDPATSADFDRSRHSITRSPAVCCVPNVSSMALFSVCSSVLSRSLVDFCLAARTLAVLCKQAAGRECPSLTNGPPTRQTNQLYTLLLITALFFAGLRLINALAVQFLAEKFRRRLLFSLGHRFT